MVQQNLVSYIISQLKTGKRLEEINRFLVEAGYERGEVESSVQYVINLQANPKLAEEQRIQQLSAYIQKQIESGYNQQIIANFLISRGYPYYEVNSALQQVTAPKKELKTEHKLVVFALIAMFLMTTAVTVMYFGSYLHIGAKLPAKLLDVEAEKLTTIVQQGGELNFKNKLINFGYEQRFDVTLTYKIIDRTTQATILEKSETVALSTTLENIVKFDIPETMKPGNYVLRVDAAYKDFTATSGFIFEVLPKELAQERIEEIKKMLPKEENITEVPELQPEEKEEVVPEETKETTPIPALQPGEIPFYEGKTREQALEAVKAVSVREPQRAIAMCKSFKYEGNAAQCLQTLAVFKKDPRLCDEIRGNSSKDMCYIELARATGDSKICDSITKSELQSSCRMMSVLNQLNDVTENKNKEDLFGLLVTMQGTTK